LFLFKVEQGKNRAKACYFLLTPNKGDWCATDLTREAPESDRLCLFQLRMPFLGSTL
jgi:hypothetical protein